MPTIPCPEKALCFDPANPFANLSSEAPDIDLAIGRSWGFGNIPPRLGSEFTEIGCNTVCQAADPVAALLCAAESWIACVQPNRPIPVHNADGTSSYKPPPIFFNSAVTISATCPDGLPFFVTVMAGRFSAFEQATADSMAESYAHRLVFINGVCMSALGASEAGFETEYSGQINATGRFSPMSFSIISGSLPPGLSMASVSPFAAGISGIPTASGVYTFTIQATDTQGDFMRKTYMITVIAITTVSPLPDGAIGTAYSQAMTLSSVPQGSQSWFISDGTLPDGLMIDPDTGVITGTPTTNGTSAFIVSMSDDIMQVDKQFIIAVKPAIACISNSGISVATNSSFPDPQSFSPSLRRTWVHDIVGAKLDIISTATDSLISSPAFSGNNTSLKAWAETAQKFFVANSSVSPQYGRIDAFDQNGVAAGNVVIDSTAGEAVMNNICYSASADRIFSLYRDNGLSKTILVSVNPSSLAVTKFNTGQNFVPATSNFLFGDVPGYVIYTDRSNNRLTILSTNGVFIQNLSITGLQITSNTAMCYNPNNGHLYVGVVQAGAKKVLEIDPATWGTVFTYAIGASQSITNLVFDPFAGAIYIGGAVLDPVNQSVFCTYSFHGNNSGPYIVDAITGKAYLANLTGGIDVYKRP